MPLLHEPTKRSQAHSYLLYGLSVRSDIPLLMMPTSTCNGDIAELSFHIAGSAATSAPDDGPVAVLRCQHGAVMVQKYATPDGCWLVMPRQGRFHIQPRQGRVDMYPEPGVDERLLGLLIAGQVSIVALHALGYPCLHAGAVTTEKGAIAFVGQKGQGKSTMAAAFMRRGATLLTDDALPLRVDGGEVYGSPGLPFMKVFRETAEQALDVPEELPRLLAELDKNILHVEGRFAFAQAPARLSAVYVLERYDPQSNGTTEITVTSLSGREGLSALLGQTSYGVLLNPAEVAMLLPVYSRLARQARVCVLRYPSGFQYQDAICQRVLDDLTIETTA